MKLKNLSFWLAIWIMLFAFLQIVYQYHFYHIEQNQLFLFDSSYFWDKISSIGGLSLYISNFFLQFFMYPYIGAIVTATLLTCTGILTMSIIKRIDPQSNAFILSLLPVITLAFMHFNFNYFMQGTIAYSVMLLFYYFYLRVNDLRWKLLYLLITTFVLFWWGGPVSLLFVSAVFITELIERPSRCYWFILPYIEAILLSWGSVRCGFIGDYRFSFLPDMYYHNWIKPDSFAIYWSWISFPFIIILAFLLRKTKPARGKKLSMSIILQFVLAGTIFWYGYKEYGDSRSLKFKELEYYARTQQWDKIIELNKGAITNYLDLSYLNMALAEKGELADKMFSFEQTGEQGIMVQWNKSHAVSMLLCDIYYAMSNISASQQMAFEANIASPGGGTGRMLKRLIQTNIIYGAYPIAEKYIDLLEKTFYYKNWATAHRKFLYNDTEVEKDPVLGNKRKSLPKEDLLFMTTGIDHELENIAISNPQNQTPIQYLGAIFLLSKRLDFFDRMIGRYYKTDILPVLPISFQEAVIILSENNPEQWMDKGASPQVANRFVEYKKFILENKNSPSLAQLVKSSYGDTYWYYYMFKNN